MKTPLVAALFLTGLPVSILAAEKPALGKLVIAGGGVYSARAEVWGALLGARVADKPIGIIATAVTDAKAQSIRTADGINKQFGEGSAIALPLGWEPGDAESPEAVKLIRGCGGFFFTGGMQALTSQALFRKDGSQTPALAAIWEVHRRGGTIGGSSAGAAVFSDPMIAGGGSAAALLHGANPHATDPPHKGIGYLPGLGFHPGVLYCQHHLERGRMGRLLGALASDRLDHTVGVGIAENSALVVDRVTGIGTVIGAKGALYLNTSGIRRETDGGFSGVRLHYLDRGDSLHFPTGKVRPAPGKSSVPPGVETAPFAAPDAWARDAIWELLQNIAKAGKNGTAVARDAHFDIHFQRTKQTGVWRHANEPEGTRPTLTLTNIHVKVTPRAKGNQ